MKKVHKPTNKIQDNISYLRTNDNTEAKRVVESVKDMPHVNKIKFLLKN